MNTVNIVKSLNESERYYYGEIEHAKELLKVGITYIQTVANNIKDATNNEDNNYTGDQINLAANITIDLEAMTSKLEEINNQLSEAFPNRIRPMTAEEKEYIDTHKDELN